MEIAKLFTYKKRDIYIKRKGKRFYVGIKSDSKNEMFIWFETIPYDSLELAIRSGREHARSVIDCSILAQKREAYDKTHTDGRGTVNKN